MVCLMLVYMSSLPAPCSKPTYWVLPASLHPLLVSWEGKKNEFTGFQCIRAGHRKRWGGGVAGRKLPVSAPAKSWWEFQRLLAQVSMTLLFLEAPLPDGQAQNDYDYGAKGSCYSPTPLFCRKRNEPQGGVATCLVSQS